MTDGRPVQEAPTLLRLMAWFSPSFPVGAYAYSHGLEFATEAGMLAGREPLEDWIARLLAAGSGRSDAVYLARSWRAVVTGDSDALHSAARLSAAQRGSRELAEESRLQGAAFAGTVAKAWPAPSFLERLDELRQAEVTLTYPVAVAVAAATAGLPLRETLEAYLHAWAANLVAAGIKLIPLGQTDGQRALAALEAPVAEAAAAALQDDGDGPVGTAVPLHDWCAMRHETQYTRLFRS